MVSWNYYFRMFDLGQNLTLESFEISSFAMFYYKSDHLQVKRNLIFSITNMVYELCHEQPNDWRLGIFRN